MAFVIGSNSQGGSEGWNNFGIMYPGTYDDGALGELNGGQVDMAFETLVVTPEPTTVLLVLTGGDVYSNMPLSSAIERSAAYLVYDWYCSVLWRTIWPLTM